jgi:endonuclease/exonuclease/phosphatase family metal-dependent hydrolase
MNKLLRRAAVFLWFAAGVNVLVSGHALLAAADDLPERLTIATWNVEWFFDNYRGDNQSDLAKQMSAPTYQDWQWRLDQVARVISGIRPTILALQEVENREVLYRLCRVLEEQHGVKYRIAFIPGFDFGTEQQVALLYRSGLVEYSRKEQSFEMFESEQYYNLSKHMFARFEWGHGAARESLLLATVHLRATPEAAGLRQKQTRLLRTWLESDLSGQNNVVVIGDFNAEEELGHEGPDSEMLILRKPTASSAELFDLTEALEPGDRVTHLAGKSYDRILANAALRDDVPERRDLTFNGISNRRDLVIRGEKDLDHRDQYYQIDPGERDVSDHYPLVAEFLVR